MSVEKDTIKWNDSQPLLSDGGVAMQSIRFSSRQRNAATASLNSSFRTYYFDIRGSFSPLYLFHIGP